jgi:cytochrome c oxidase assembly factor CtaG
MKRSLFVNQDTGLFFLLTQWNWQPSILIGTIVVIALYLYAVGPLRVKYRLGPALPAARVFAFLLGVYLIFIALFSALDTIGDTYLFVGHMIQHMLISLAAPPLLLVGLPAWLLQPLLRNRFTLHLGNALTQPIVAAGLFNVNLWIWHAPPLYHLTLINEPLHIFSHLLYIATGMLFWWPLLSPLKEGWPPLPLGGKLAYIFFSDMPMVLLGAGLTFMPPLYSFYLHAPRLWGITPAVDQQLGGLLMWIVGSIFLVVMVSMFFLRWMLQQERADRDQVTWETDGADEPAPASEQVQG